MTTNDTNSRYRVGQLRPSQLLFTYGIGSIVDLPNLSTMVMGLEDWEITYAQDKEIYEPRLLYAVQASLGKQVAKLLSPPALSDQTGGLPFSPFDVGALIGVPVAVFPRWMVCPQCRRLEDIDGSGLFQLKAEPYNPDRMRYVHINCGKAKLPPPVLPARFLVACEAGHLDDFPWIYFVHFGQPPCPNPTLHLRELGVSGEAASIQVDCTCGQKRRMSEAIGQEARKNLPACTGRRPHLRDYESGCKAKSSRTVTLGASNSWFPVLLSTLSIPKGVDNLGELVEQHWNKLEKTINEQNIKLLRDVGQLFFPVTYTDGEIWERVAQRQAATSSGEAEQTKSFSLKAPEWQVLTNPSSVTSTRDFTAKTVTSPVGYEHLIKQVVLVDRLREVRAVTGFTRIESPGDLAEDNQVAADHRVPLSRKAPNWIPASEVRGEGIFIQFDEAVIMRWLEDEARQKHNQAFFEAHCRWRESRHIPDPQTGYPGLRYALLHSFSHALMRQLALECGYTAASIRERIYSLPPEAEHGPMAGVLLYTAAPDSEGTLGGLVALGTPEELSRHLVGALDSIRLCASDPLCAEHSSGREGSLHWAACHACLFAPETSCERGNKYLDRSLLIETVDKTNLAFFD
ncbi:MAG: DUF1998 domain-containing protein [Chloroflexi bacterium]|nr:DUF1998 domain-containing protein [Chloroflexota bacterium]